MEVSAIREGSLDGRRLYLDLLKRCLTRMLFPDGSVNGDLSFSGDFDRQKRMEGRDWPAQAETMVGLRRLDNLQECIADVIQRHIPGDLVEAGVWRGGASIMMRAVLAAYGDVTRRVWLADSLQGLPLSIVRNIIADAGDRHWELSFIWAYPWKKYRRISGDTDFSMTECGSWSGGSRVTPPAAPISSIAVLRVDGDMYQSTRMF